MQDEVIPAHTYLETFQECLAPVVSPEEDDNWSASKLDKSRQCGIHLDVRLTVNTPSEVTAARCQRILTFKVEVRNHVQLVAAQPNASRSGNPACPASTRSATRITSEPVPTIWAPRRSFGQLSRTLPVEQKIGSSLSRSQMLLAQPTPTLGSSIVPGLFQHRSYFPRCQHLLISQRGRATKVRAEEQKAGRARQKKKGTAQRASQWKQESIGPCAGRTSRGFPIFEARSMRLEQHQQLFHATDTGHARICHRIHSNSCSTCECRRERSCIVCSTPGNSLRRLRLSRTVCLLNSPNAHNERLP